MITVDIKTDVRQQERKERFAVANSSSQKCLFKTWNTQACIFHLIFFGVPSSLVLLPISPLRTGGLYIL